MKKIKKLRYWNKGRKKWTTVAINDKKNIPNKPRLPMSLKKWNLLLECSLNKINFREYPKPIIDIKQKK